MKSQTAQRVNFQASPNKIFFLKHYIISTESAYLISNLHF
jgi:hypothetical protein